MIKIGGFQRFSLIDYPGKLSAIIFTQGCNFRCPYCHNPELVDPDRFSDLISSDAILDFLETRKGKLDAVSITGGEPTLQENLPEYMEKIKQKGFLIKLDTNGTNPEMLKELIKDRLADYLAMDIKGPSDKYHIVAGTFVDTDWISESIEIIKNSGIDYEFRSTLVDNLITSEGIRSMCSSIGNAKRYFLQKFIADKTLDASYSTAQSISQDKMHILKNLLQSQAVEFNIR
jgi:pyruvate formate lyase activating enzyme